MSEVCQWLHEHLKQLSPIQFPFDVEQLPDNGIYFFYEEGEFWGHGKAEQRIVRIGTHRDGNFKDRISQHFLLDESKMDFNKDNQKPSDRSIFRKHIGRSLLCKRNDSYLKVWNISFTEKEKRKKYSHLRDIPKEKDLESEITEMLRNRFSFRFIIRDNQVERMGSEGLESSLIGTVSHCQLCRPSTNWLGRYHPRRAVKESGLWLVQHLKANEMSEAEKDTVSQAIKATKEWISNRK